MNVREALKNSVSFPLAPGQVEVIAVKRGLNLDADFTSSVAKSESYELTYADALKLMVTQPNVSEGGVSISVSDKKSLISIANSIYRKYGESVIQEARPAVYPILD